MKIRSFTRSGGVRGGIHAICGTLVYVLLLFLLFVLEMGIPEKIIHTN